MELFCLQVSFLKWTYSPLRPWLDALSHCKQKKKAKLYSIKKAKAVREAKKLQL